MASTNPYNQYLNVSFSTTEQDKLILMAYDGAIRFCRAAVECLETDDKIGKGDWLSKAYDTVAELRKSLRPDLGGDIATHLSDAYDFVGKQITLGNVMNRPEYVLNAISMLESMREAWRDAFKQMKQQIEQI